MSSPNGAAGFLHFFYVFQGDMCLPAQDYPPQRLAQPGLEAPGRGAPVQSNCITAWASCPLEHQARMTSPPPSQTGSRVIHPVSLFGLL